ncbi:serine hydrolase [Chitinibacter fontanus]|uniref:Serine hydrolase n=1 Tax=Chitinibacter fontanus TaxID=1737446 RepID=A0A7D5VBQ2_9NEIS|nr:serine hydrolase [Chitinibacter fontanus]QLI83071.1 serine hydrolase [Chitinibacter fontanus]
MYKVIAIAVAISASVHAAELPSASPESQGFESAKLANLLQVIEREGWAIDSLLLMRNGKVVLDSYFYPYAPNQLHDMRSVTKSVVSTMLGISLEQKKLASLNQPVLPFYPTQAKQERDARKKTLSLENLIDMRSGLQWTEWPYTPDSTIYQMYRSSDQRQFVIGLPLVDKPGVVFSYNGGNMNLLSGVIEQAWGETMRQVARKQLFSKLGIEDCRWASDPQGHTIGEAGLYLKPHDMARLGQFWLDDGVIAGERFLPTAWTQQLLADGLPASLGMQYRRGFWISPEQGIFQAHGRHGQMIMVSPKDRVVMVVTGKFNEQTKEWYELYPLFTRSMQAAPLAENPAAQLQLNTVIASVARAKPEASSIALGEQWQGKLWQLAENPAGINSIEFIPDPGDTGAMKWRVAWSMQLGAQRQSGINEWKIGFDGAYRMQADPLQNGAILALRGRWLDTHTLQLHTQYPSGGMKWEYQMRFTGDSVAVHVADNEAVDMHLTGQLKQ